MSRLWRNLLSVGIGFFFGGLGAFLVAIFWPLLFPMSLQGSSRGEDAVPLAFFGAFSLFGVAGFLLFRRLTRKYVRDSDTFTGLFR